MASSKRLAILVGGGPAPGINAVISAAAIQALNLGFDVIGVRDGFKRLVRRDPTALQPLTIDDVSRVHLNGGSVLGTSRENPTKSAAATRAVIDTLREAGITHLVTITDKNVGYELRCADPIPFDAEYCRDLGYGAVRFLVDGGSGAMVSVQGGRLVPIPFDDLVEPGTGKTKVRLVDVNSEGFRVARAYMIRLEADDFAHAAWVDRLADAANLSPGAFRQRFEYLAAGQ